MAAPQKPWETRRTAQNSPAVNRSGRYSPRLSPPVPTALDGSSSAPPLSRQPPPPPARSTSLAGNGAPYSRFGGFNSASPFTSPSSYGNYGGNYGVNYGGNYGGNYGNFGGYGGGGYGPTSYRPYGSYGNQYGREGSQFLRQAEDRTRPAFQSVESVVGAVGSIAMMLDSTYMAIHTCFRAILGVIDHFSTVRAHLWEIISAITVLRWLRNLLRGLLNLIRRNHSASKETAWEDTMATSEVVQAGPGPVPAASRSTNVWPAIAFFATAIGVPWLLWRLVSGLAKAGDSSEEGQGSWLNEPAAVKCVALYPYTAQRQDEMSFDAGQQLVLAPPTLQPRVQGWALAANTDQEGLVPQNYIQPLPASGTEGSGGQAPSLPTPPN